VTSYNFSIYGFWDLSKKKRAEKSSVYGTKTSRSLMGSHLVNKTMN
jgi:hypothetical protein